MVGSATAARTHPVRRSVPRIPRRGLSCWRPPRQCSSSIPSPEPSKVSSLDPIEDAASPAWAPRRHGTAIRRWRHSRRTGTRLGGPSAMSITGKANVLRVPAHHKSSSSQDDRVIAITTAEKARETPAGIGVGDDLDSVRAAYPVLKCWDAPHAVGHGTYPVCKKILDKIRWLWLGQDPIWSIAVAYPPTRLANEPVDRAEDRNGVQLAVWPFGERARGPRGAKGSRRYSVTSP